MMSILRKFKQGAILAENRHHDDFPQINEATMDNLAFTGRSLELEYLSSTLRTKTASLIIVKGRRRVGKSRLIKDFS